jgi:ribose transport system permease protein
VSNTSATFNERSPKRLAQLGRLFRKYGTFVIFVLLVVFASSQSNAFMTLGNVMNMLLQMSGIGLMSVGMLLVILTAGIDLSVGSIAALGSVVSALLLNDYPVYLAVLMVVGIGAACGAVSGILVAFFRLPAFVITLAMMTAARGYALIVSNGQTVLVGQSGQPLTDFGTSYVLGLPGPAIVMFVAFLTVLIVLNFTRFGRLVKAIGSNEEAVRLSGISVPLHVLLVYVISGALAAIAGIMITARSGVGSPDVATGDELNAIAAVVIGGASLMGGSGGAINTFFGVMILGIIGNIMNLAGVPGYDQEVYLGIIIVIAVVIQNASTVLRR